MDSQAPARGKPAGDIGRGARTGLSDRTLRRRIIDDGAAFRQMLLEARRELAHEYLNRPEMDVTEVAFLLGYEDSNSFYRAFRTWEETTPSQLRAVLRRSETRQ
jgi:AraC-like DNA-binding protein